MLCVQGPPSAAFALMNTVRQQFSLNHHVPMREKAHAVNPFHHEMEDFDKDLFAEARAQVHAAEKERDQAVNENHRLKEKVDRLDQLVVCAGKLTREAREKQEDIQAALDLQRQKLETQATEHQQEMAKQTKIVHTLAKRVQILDRSNSKLRLKVRELKLGAAPAPRRAPSLARRHGAGGKRTEKLLMGLPAIPTNHRANHSVKRAKITGPE